VAFFQNGFLLHKDLTAPYSYTWTNVPANNYILTARASDTLGATSTSAPISVSVGTGVPTNQPPIARPGGPYTGAPGVAIQFNGSTSTDADGTITTYQWDFGDNIGGSGATTTHSYSSPGQYTVRLTVTDNQGATHSATTTATVTAGQNLPPVSNPGGPYTGVAGLAFSLTAAVLSTPTEP
jgi:PKD repeat protein